MIVYLQRNEINIEKWDRSIDKAVNSLVYAYSWYLDIVCDGQWGALVNDDYEFVMPLPWRKRMGLPYIYQPFCTPQLGIFGIDVPDNECVQAFQRAIPKSFRLVDQKVNIHHAIHLSSYASTHTTYHLNLQADYNDIKEGYHSHTRRSLRKSAKQFLELQTNVLPSVVMDLFKSNKGLEIDDVKEADYLLLLKVLETATEKDLCKTYGVYNESGECIAGACFVFGREKIFFLLSAVNEEGKSKRAMYYLLDGFFSAHHSQGYTFDFEGSDIPGLARFYGGFGAEPKTYKKMYINNLPSIIKWMK